MAEFATPAWPASAAELMTYSCLPVECARTSRLLGSLVETFRLKVCAAPGVVGGIKGIGGNLTRGEVQRRLLTGGVALRFKVTSDVWMNAMMVNYLAPLLDSRMWDADEQAATSQEVYLGKIETGPLLFAGSVVYIAMSRQGVRLTINGQDLGLVPSSALGRAQLAVYFDRDADLPEWRDAVVGALTSGNVEGGSVVIMEESVTPMPRRREAFVRWTTFFIAIVILVVCICSFRAFRRGQAMATHT